MSRVYNFSAGPACLPVEVLQKAQEQMLDYQGTGMSVMEMSHRSKAYEEIIGAAESNLRKLMNIPENYKVLFLQGGASLQFAMVPMNLLSKHKKAHYVNTGLWSKKAIKEAKRFGEVNVAASSEDQTFSYIPKLSADIFTPDADYVHITTNNTIYGTKFKEIPETNGIPLVTDMSSCILSEEVDVSKYGIIYAGAQKNIGPAGLTIVIIRDDLIGNVAEIPTMLDYKTHADAGSMFNTPPTYAIYIAGLVFEWLLELGGLGEIQKVNERKAAILYDYLDNSGFYKGTARKEDRSLMNVPFVIGDPEMEKKFVAEATAAGFVNLKGHRTVGGMRASIYNAMPVEGIEKLTAFMEAFKKNNA